MNDSYLQLAVQAGGVGIAALLIWLIGKKIDRLHDAIMQLAYLIVDHKARHGDDTPPDMQTPRRGTPRGR